MWPDAVLAIVTDCRSLSKLIWQPGSFLCRDMPSVPGDPHSSLISFAPSGFGYGFSDLLLNEKHKSRYN